MADEMCVKKPGMLTGWNPVCVCRTGEVYTTAKETIKNLIELSDTETYKGVPAKHTHSHSLAVSSFPPFIYYTVPDAVEGLGTSPLCAWKTIGKNL